MAAEKAPILVVANPNSGGGLAGELVPHLVRDLGRLGFATEVFQSSGPHQITARARAVRAGDWYAVVVVGGDGTVREVLQADLDAEVPLAVLPAGTANVLAADFRLPKAPRDTAAMVAALETRRIDRGIMRREGAPDLAFQLFIGAGTDGRLVHQVHEQRQGGTSSKLKWVAPFVKALWNYEPVEHWIVLENGERHGPFEQVLVTNVTSYGGVWKLPRGIEVDDGLFDCLGFRAKTAGALFRHGVRGVLNKLRESDDLVHLQASHVRVEAEGESPVQIDGDPGGFCPVDVVVEPARIRLVVPPRSGGA